MKEIRMITVLALAFAMLSCTLIAVPALGSSDTEDCDIEGEWLVCPFNASTAASLSNPTFISAVFEDGSFMYFYPNGEVMHSESGTEQYKRRVLDDGSEFYLKVLEPFGSDPTPRIKGYLLASVGGKGSNTYEMYKADSAGMYLLVENKLIQYKTSEASDCYTIDGSLYILGDSYHYLRGAIKKSNNDFFVFDNYDEGIDSLLFINSSVLELLE